MNSMVGNAMSRLIFTIIVIAVIVAAFTYIFQSHPLQPIIEQLQMVNDMIKK